MFRKIITVLLCVFMIAGSVIPQKNTPVYAFSSFTNESEIAGDDIIYPTTSDDGFDITSVDLINEEISMRTVDSKTFRKVDGTYVMAIYNSPIHYEKDGKFVEIDNSLVLDESTDDYENIDNKYKIKLPKELGDNKKIKLTLDDYQIDWSISEAKDSDISYSESTKEVNGLKDLSNINQRITYSNIQDNVNLEYILSGNSIKENIILDKYIENYSITFTYTVKNLTLAQDSSGSYLFINDLGEVIFYMNSFFMFDSDDLDSEAVSVDVYEIKKDEYQVTITPDNDFLMNASYPVTIDPTLVYDNGTSIIRDKYVYSTYSTSNSYLKAGYRDTYSYYYRSYMEFDLTELPNDMQINYAHLSLSIYGNICTSDVTIVANEVVESQAYDGTYGINGQLMDIVEDRPLDYFNVAEGNTGTYKLDLTHAFSKWTSEGDTARIIELRRLDETDPGYIIFYSNDYAQTTSPVLEIGFVNTAGIKDFWTYSSQDVGLVGTGYVSDYTGYLTFLRTDINFETDKQGLGVSFAFSNTYKDINVGYGDGWNINYNKKIVYDDDCDEFYMQEADGNKVYFNYESVEYPYGGVSVYKYISEDGRGLELYRSFYTSQLMSITIKDTSDNTYTFSTTNNYLVSISNLYSITTTINRNTSIPERINYIKDASDNYLRFNYDDGKLSSILLRTDAIETDPNASETDFLEKVEYEYADYTDKLVRVKYLSDYNQDQDTNIDVTVNYQYDAYERFRTGYISGGEKIIYNYISNTNNSIEMIESFNDDEKFSEIIYEYMFLETIITDHTDNFVIYKFDQYGHTVNIIDRNANTIYYEYIDIFSDDTSEYYMEYIRNHDMVYESTPQKMTYNPIDNFSFESDSLTGWSISGNISYEVDDGNGFVGDNCLKLDDSNDLGGYAYQSISLNEGVYTFRASIYYASGSSSGAYIEALGENTEPVDSSSEWQNISLPLYVSHDETDVVLKLYNNTGEIVKYDNISIIENINSSEYNIVNNGSFEISQSGTWGWGFDYLLDYYTRYSINDGSGDIDDTFESILGEYAYGILGSPNSLRRSSTSISKNYIDELGTSGTLYVGGWGNNYSSPFTGSMNLDEDKIFRINVEFYNGIYKINDYSQHIDFDQSVESWQYVYKEINTPSSYTSIKISIEYQGLGEVIFDGITAFFEATEKTYDYDAYDRLERISFGEGTEYNFVYNSNEDRYPSEVRDKEYILLMTLDSDGSVLEYITQYNVTSTPTYNANGQVTEVEITGYATENDFINESETSYFTTSTTYLWDNQYIASTEDEFGYITEYQTNEFTGLLEHIENSKDVKTQYEYYDNGMLYHVYIGESTSGAPYVKYEYDDQFRLVKIELDTNYYYAINYDDAGRISSVQVNTNTLMSYSYKENEVNLISKYIFGNYNIYESTGVIYTNSSYSTVTYNGESIELETHDLNRDPSFGGFIKVEPNTEYTVSAEILSITGSVMINIFEYSGEPDTSTYIGVTKSSSTNSIGKLTKTFTTSSSTKYVIIAFYDSSTFTIEFRDLLLDKNDDIETGILSSQTYGNGDKITFVYNNDGQVEYIRFTDNLGNETTRFHYLYDSYGRVSIYEDLVNGTSESYEYDMQGRIVRVKHSNEDEILYGYDVFGNLNSVVYNLGTITSETAYNYETGANQGFFNNTVYDNGGNEIERKYIYDDYGLKNLEEIQVILDGNTESYFDIEFEYSTNQVRIDTITYNFITTDYTDISYIYYYDSLGNITKEEYLEDESVRVRKEYVYDDYNQLIKESSRDFQYSVQSSYEDTNYTKYYHYDINGNLTEIKSLKYGESEYTTPSIPSFYLSNNGSYTAVMFYNGSNDYRDIYNLSIGQSPSLSFTYYDMWDTHHDFPLTGMTTTMTYSNLNTSVAGYYYRTYRATYGNYDLTFRIVFKVGNPAPIETTPQEMVSFDYDDVWLDQLESYDVLTNGVTTTSEIDYDNQGNPTQITNFNYMGDICDSATLTWEGRNLVNITVYDSSFENNAQIDYTYNDQDIRIMKVITDDYGITMYEYILSGDILVAEIVDNAFNVSTEQRNIDYKILYNYDFDGSLIGFTYYTQTTTVDYLYIINQLGDITHIVDTSGNIVVQYSYDGYGNIVHVDGTLKNSIGLFNSFRYRSYKYDEESSLYYLQSRYYNPETSRFINADSLSGIIKQGNIANRQNLYSYCLNNPVKYTDDSGEFIIAFGMLLGAVAGLFTAINNDQNVWIGLLTGAFLGASAGLLIQNGGIGLIAGAWSLGGKLLADITAYTSFGAPFSNWEEYSVAFILGGATGALGMFGFGKIVVDSFAVPFSYQLTQLGTRNRAIDANKLLYSFGVRFATSNLGFVQKSVMRGLAKGIYWRSQTYNQNNADSIELLNY